MEDKEYTFKREREEFEKVKKKNPKLAEQLDKYFQYLKSITPYQYVIEYAKMNQKASVLGDNSFTRHRQEWGTLMLLETSKDINENLRLLEIDPDLKPMIENTDNKLFYRPLFFSHIFVNCDFTYEDITIRGLLLIDHNQLGGYPFDKRGEIALNDWTIFAVAVNLKERYEYYGNFRLLSEELLESYYEDKKDVTLSKKLWAYARTIAVNIIDLVEGNDKDIKIITTKTTVEDNDKRKKRGKIPMPTKVYIRPKDSFREEIRAFNEEHSRGSISHKFIVRGHWVHFTSERYKEMQGKKIWRKPFYKGKGLLVKKDYKMT